ncbi:hypothetical protein [Psychromonas sp.]|uniref:hypothetical protein n=1 Tax=Psychromonas sp. TaxID=1884585 RepID=UPI0035613A31
MLAEDTRFVALDKLSYPLVNQFYKQVYKKGMASKDESVFVIKGKSILCSAKLKSVDGHLLLTGVASATQIRGLGYASYLIKKIVAQQSLPVYCFPYQHLETFYLQLGFVPVAAEAVPEVINKLFAGYNRKQALLLMCHPTPSQNC